MTDAVTGITLHTDCGFCLLFSKMTVLPKRVLSGPFYDGRSYSKACQLEVEGVRGGSHPSSGAWKVPAVSTLQPGILCRLFVFLTRFLVSEALSPIKTIRHNFLFIKTCFKPIGVGRGLPWCRGVRVGCPLHSTHHTVGLIILPSTPTKSESLNFVPN